MTTKSKKGPSLKHLSFHYKLVVLCCARNVCFLISGRMPIPVFHVHHFLVPTINLIYNFVCITYICVSFIPPYPLLVQWLVLFKKTQTLINRFANLFNLISLHLYFSLQIRFFFFSLH